MNVQTIVIVHYHHLRCARNVRAMSRPTCSSSGRRWSTCGRRPYDQGNAVMVFIDSQSGRPPCGRGNAAMVDQPPRRRHGGQRRTGRRVDRCPRLRRRQSRGRRRGQARPRRTRGCRRRLPPRRGRESADGHLRRGRRLDRRGSRCQAALTIDDIPRPLRASAVLLSPYLPDELARAVAASCGGALDRGTGRERLHRPRPTRGRLRGRLYDARGRRRRRRARRYEGVPWSSGSGRRVGDGRRRCLRRRLPRGAGARQTVGGVPRAGLLARLRGRGERGRAWTRFSLYHAGSGPLAQLVEQGTFNPKVVGSIPTRPIHSDTNLTRRGRVDSAVVASYAESSVG